MRRSVSVKPTYEGVVRFPCERESGGKFDEVLEADLDRRQPHLLRDFSPDRLR